MGDEFIVANVELQLVLDSFERRAKNLSRLTPIIAEMLVAEVHDVFEAEGPGWPALAPSTLLKRRGGTGKRDSSGRFRKRAASSSTKILQDSGNLVTSVHGEHGSDWASAATNVPYVRYHLEGGPIIPKRNPFELTDQQADRLSDEVVDMLLAELVAE